MHHKSKSNEIFLSYLAKKIKRAVIFYHSANPAETADLSFLDRELFNALGLLEKLQFTPSFGGPKRACSDGLHAEIIKSQNFLFLRLILVKVQIETPLFESFLTTYQTWRP